MTTARELMTRDLLTIEQTDTVDRALEILSLHELRHVPVVDDEGRLVGMLSDRDLRDQGIAQIAEVGGTDRLRARLAQRAMTVMARHLVVLEPDDDLGVVLDRMIASRHGALPVVERGTRKLVGLVSYLDVLRAMRAALRRTAPRPARVRSERPGPRHA